MFQPAAGRIATVMLVDDDPTLLSVLATILDGEEDLALVASTVDPYEAFDVWRSSRPDIVVLDERIGTLSGLQVAERMLRDAPEQAIVLFTAYPTRPLLAAAASLGVRDVVSKSDIADLVEVLRTQMSPAIGGAPAGDALLTVHEAAELLDLTARHVRDLVEAGRLRAITRGRAELLREADVRQLLRDVQGRPGSHPDRR